MDPANHFISLDEAKKMAAEYRKGKEVILNGQYAGKNILPTCETFSRQAFDKILENSECASIRIYYGMDEGLKIHSIIVGVNSKGEDILTAPDSSIAGDDIIENGTRCPVICPTTSGITEFD